MQQQQEQMMSHEQATDFWMEINKHLKKIENNTDGPAFVDALMILDEFNVTPNGSSVTLTPAIDRPALISVIITSIPTGTSGILTIGASGQGPNKRMINITPTTSPMTNLLMIIYPQDVLQLTVTGGTGVVFIEIMGGLLRKGDWRVI
jgi:hypothetical protein